MEIEHGKYLIIRLLRKIPNKKLDCFYWDIKRPKPSFEEGVNNGFKGIPQGWLIGVSLAVLVRSLGLG